MTGTEKSDGKGEKIHLGLRMLSRVQPNGMERQIPRAKTTLRMTSLNLLGNILSTFGSETRNVN